MVEIQKTFGPYKFRATPQTLPDGHADRTQLDQKTYKPTPAVRETYNVFTWTISAKHLCAAFKSLLLLDIISCEILLNWLFEKRFVHNFLEGIWSNYLIWQCLRGGVVYLIGHKHVHLNMTWDQIFYMTIFCLWSWSCFMLNVLCSCFVQGYVLVQKQELRCYAVNYLRHRSAQQHKIRRKEGKANQEQRLIFRKDLIELKDDINPNYLMKNEMYK